MKPPSQAANLPLLSPKPVSKVLGHRPDATAVVIGALLSFIKGEDCGQKHPDYKSENQLIELLAATHKGYAGASVRNFKEWFSQAKKVISLST